ncbi:hypothetical protein JCM3775_005784 [Rhodotorula graminis]|uniref:GSKIP domain-containing protein n=1 Tax=Rhodotorula graminis (strain WP1) TaxID=578459 RepID=A0A194S526_RHOGW|nr:uncharacterized protein RHOBADRAFT_52676 [Rhodotorula graminis WP1]KPV75629.1 hypothetical protein RHOBADRAFT_52676 [Rhodotorula graminis WP1]
MPSTFAAGELEQALSEIPWGIRTHQLLPDDPSTPSAARAEIALLDDDESAVSVACAESGWAIVGSRGRCMKPGRSFDTLDDLLLAISPAFETARINKLMEKLAGVAQERGERAHDLHDEGPEAAHAP